jgi:small subunit ribosomal protein S13
MSETAKKPAKSTAKKLPPVIKTSPKITKKIIWDSVPRGQASSKVRLGAPTAIRISGVELLNKRLVIALTYIHGIGLSIAQKICATLQINENIRVPDLTEDQIASIRDFIAKNYTIEGDRRKEVVDSIKSLIAKGTYRGSRHRKGLPVRGQNTKTNAKTRKKKGKKS